MIDLAPGDTNVGSTLLVKEWVPRSTPQAKEHAMTKTERKKTRPTTSKELEITRLVEATGVGDTVEEIYGPTKVADSVVWEVWVYDNDELLATRFVEEFPGGVAKVYDTFQQIAVRLDSQHAEIVMRLQAAEWQKTKEMVELQLNAASLEAKAASERLTGLITLIVASGVFVISVLIMAYLVVKGGPYFIWIAAFVLGCVIASACTFFYRQFVILNLPTPPRGI